MKVVLLDGPDFQDLSERANHLFLALKLSFGPTGIEVHYPAALAAEMAAKTRIPARVVEEVLEELRDAGWIDWERNVFWITGQLEHEPHFNAQNERHRKAVQAHVGGLPRLSIVRRFIDRYAEYFGDAPEGLLDSLPRSPSHSPSKQGVGNREEGRGIQATVDSSLRSSSTGAAAPPNERSVDWSKRSATRRLIPDVAPLVRHHLWLSGRPPPQVLELDPKWNESREADVVRCWLKDGEVADLEEALAVVRLARHACDIDGPFSLLFLNSTEHHDRFQEALQYARKELVVAAAKKRKPGAEPVRIGDGVEEAVRGR